LQAGFNTHFRGKRKYSIRLSMAEAYQKEQRLLNGSASLFFTYNPDDTDPYGEIRDLIRKKKLPSMRLASPSNISSYLLSASAFAFQRFIYKHKARIKLIMMMEQEPTPDSFISLSDKKDLHGTRQALIHWKITRKTWDSVLHLSDVVSKEMQRLSLGKVTLHNHVRADNPDWESCLTDVNHHMGGARMSATPAEGVVDTDLKVWAHDNLYVCSTSVFPTVSHSNPTLTLLALAERLAGQL
jgi:choline dehydrogenase-like flavoprotein